MKKLQYILLAAGLWMAGVTCVMADVPAANIRYVLTGGKFTNNGKSWETAKNNIQDAINSLVADKALPGEVWVGAGTYTPTESTESSGGSTLYMSFKIPAGVTVRGGFPANGKVNGEDAGAYITRADQRRMNTTTEVGAFTIDQTILSGDLSAQTATFEYNSTRDQFTTTFYGNSYHVVTFATNGFHADGHAKALDTSKGEAALDGVIIEHGNAHFTATGGHPHEAYGGGIYMVKGSHVYNTCVRQCEATRAGGGIYMDGGGFADHVYVSECQALGLGTTYGYGGGVCMEDGTYESTDATKGMYPTVVRRSGITGCVARNGGGMAIYCNNVAYKNRLAVSALMVTNNVAQNEAGGIYLYQGGAISQATVVRNKCIGSGIAVNGMVNGRSGGIYVRDYANIANSVIWGNECRNRDVQYAGSRSSNEDAKKPLVRCTMLSRADYADWSGVIKYQVNDLNEENKPALGRDARSTAHTNYPAFKNPTATAGYISDIYQRSLMPEINNNGDTTKRAYSWKVEYSSSLTNAGVQTIDLDTAGVTPAVNESQDIMGEVFSSHPTLGAYTSTSPVAWPWDNRGQDQTMHLFVDPDADYTDQSARIGDSWDNAAHNLNDVLNLMQQTLNAFQGDVQPSRANLVKLLVHVKEGKVTNNGAYSIGHVRNITLRIPYYPEGLTEDLPIEILGGYPSDLTGHDVSVRNPLKYPTIITGDIIDDYNYNVSHLVTMDGAKNVTIDGFQLRNGNASSTKEENTNRNGAAFTIKNSTGIHIKNCVVANCQAEIGAAVYADNSVVDFENCIFHNNASTQQVGLAANMPSIIYSGGTGTLTFDHCDVLRNVGYASWVTSTAYQVWTNSIFYGNMNQAVDDTNDAVENGTHYVMATPAFGGATANVSGRYCQFDGKSRASMESIFTEGSLFTLSYVFDGGANSKYPRFINPTKNAGISPSGDITYYGRTTSFEPHNTNPMVNAADTKGVAHTSASSSDCWGKDISAVINRDYGGLPDIGAVENHYAEKSVDGENAYADGQGFYGRTLYVRDYGNLTEGGDGSSWKNAINGNAYYHEASGNFMGATKNGTITWTEIAKETTTNYGSPATTYEASTEQDPKLFLISSVTAADKYLKVAANGTFSLVTDKTQASEFIITAQGAIYDYNNHFYVSLNITSQTTGKGKDKVTTYSATFETSATPRTWNFNTSQGKIYITQDGQSYIWSVKDASATAPSLSWKDWVNDQWRFISVEHIIAGTPTVHTQEVVGIEGLQYAVNKAAILNEGDNIRREVWVGAGTYEKDNETITTDRHFPLDYTNWDESCFIIRDGVDVYGAFPKAGNPGKDQRQALVSTHVTSIAGYDPAEFETILQPKTKSQTAGTRHRVLGQPYACNKKASNYYDYKGATWDGFTLQNGFLDANGIGYVSRNGGGGAAVYYNVTLRNMVVAGNKVVYQNAGGQQDFRAGGIYMDGGTLEAGYVINNTLEAWDNNSVKSKSRGAAYGGGMYIYKGTVYNSVVSHNLIYANYADGAGIFIENADFFNNTIVNNKAEGTTRTCGGIAIWTSGAGSVLNVYNSIILNNITSDGAGKGGIGTGQNLRVPNKGVMNIHNSIVDKMTNTGSGDKAIYFMDCATATMSNTLFATPGSYNDNFKNLNMRLAKGSAAINKGDVNPVLNGQVYDLSNYTDMDYTERVKDCSIDVGAYEYNDAYAISPDVTTVDGQAIYYVTPLGSGYASAENPENAACAEKLQKVLDAAGRYKFQHPEKQVIVKVAKENFKDIDPDADYTAPSWGGQASDITTMTNNRQYLSDLKLMAGSTTLFTETGLIAPADAAATFKLFEPSPAVKVNAGSELTIILTLPIINETDSAKDVVANIWMDTNGDKTLDRQLALVGQASAKNYLDTVKVIIPSTARNGATRLRIRLDSSYKIATSAGESNNRMVYDIPIEVTGSLNNNFFSYYATRSTDPTDQDVRIWSIMVPRGVEVWGGYSDAPMKMVNDTVVLDTEHSWSNQYNGFYTPAAGGEPAIDLRDIVGNATYFDATYVNKLEKTTATTYHIVTFTDRIFDANGNPYLAGDEDLTHDSHYNPDLAYENEADYKHMSDNPDVTDRAVLDGIFLTGGKADAPASREQTLQTIHQFGGAAVVEPYAHVRNCIVENNTATYGGALALKEKALVSGCLIRNNKATNKGAGIYVFEDGAQLSESARVGRYTVHTAQGSEAKMDANMPHVFLSTVVRNEAQQGGGLWFTNSEANVRVNSTVLWRNIANDQENVSGAYSPEKPESDQTSTTEFYPFAYSAVQNLRMSGTNNMMLQPTNKNGARFAKNEDIDRMAIDETDFTDFGYYGLTGLSALVRTGMSLHEFDSLRAIHHFAAADFMALDRKANDPNAPARTYVEIGARALLKPFQSKQLMLRLYVAQPEDMDADAAMAMKSMALHADPASDAEYYSQEGSSFAYPFQSLQDALDYIYLVRSTKEYKNGQSYMQVYRANNLPFEIMIAKGTYYPTRDLAGHYGESLANTFAVPEGVSLYGGFAVKQSDGHWDGRYVKAKNSIPAYNTTDYTSTNNYDISGFVDSIPDAESNITLTIDGTNYNIHQTSSLEMFRCRTQIDINKNSIIEPWEFENQTILSGNSTNADGHGVYHIVTICPDEDIVGILPDPMYELSETEKGHYAEGYGPNEMGQYTHFNGITFQGGRAHTYSSELDEMAKYNYYHGGAVLADGNRYNNNYNDSVHAAAAAGGEWNASTWEHKATDYKHLGYTNAVGYRDIPVSFASCRFYDNEAGYGGAISTNVEIELYQSSFEHNMASYFSDQVSNEDNTGKINVTYAGQGGAVFSTYHVTAYNTLFANNEARDTEHTTIAPATYYSYRNYDKGGSNELPGTGGAIYSGVKGNMHLFNCDIVRNMANSFPAVFTMNPNYYTSDWNDGTEVESMWFNQIDNTVLWGNELNAAAKGNGANASKLFGAQMVTNYGAATRNGADYTLTFPASQAELDDAAHDGNLTAKAYTEMLHFCAYEPGRGITPKNENDFRMCKTNSLHHTIYQFSHIEDTTTVADDDYFPYQNSNIAISSDNDELEGPAFMRPSTAAGIDGYMEAADWAPARLNNLTDNGNTRLDQTIREVDGKKVAEFVKQDGKFVGSGAYWISRYYSMYPNYMHNLPIGDEHYMTSQGAGDDQQMYRISLDPNPTHNQSYIDIGVYEYIHVPLEPETEDEVDILWVSNFEKPENGLPNGHTWLTPTSDLQRAIETLLASRNGHRKEIRLCDGTYAPIYTIDGTLSFYIDSKYLNEAATGGVSGSGHETGYGVKSLTIKGGYSREYNGLYDVDLYPAIIKQQTTATASPKYDHLIYINDATQRYHATGTDAYAKGNGFGWWNGSEKSAINTFPIQIDGVTLINDQASGAGAAIFYRNQTFDSDFQPVNDVASTAYTAAAPTSASITTGKDAGGHHTWTDRDNPAKLIITKTTVLGSGTKDHNPISAAVYVCPDGGTTLVYNSLFHSNFGDPLSAANATVVNNTFALNGGEVRLGGSSKMFNNVLWRNGGHQLMLDGLTYNETNHDFDHDATTKNFFAYNAYTGGDTEDIDYTEGAGKPVYEHNYNVGLVDLNTDVTYGPNFRDPENADLLKRDFHISPSMRLLNKGSNALYGDTALDKNTGVYDLAWEVTKRYDLATNNRIAAATIDLGAYEYQYDLNRVLYVDPNKATSGDGLSWEEALGFGNIQNAIDLAGVAHSNLKKSTYVFVKAASSTNLDLHTGETLTLRDGVQVYGSVMADYGVECPFTQPAPGSTERTFEEAILEAYVGDVLLYGRYGTISPVEGHTRIAGINTNGTAFTATGTPDRTIIDGFEVMPKDAAAANITAPVIHITPYKSDGQLATGGTKIGLRNIAVHDYKATGCNVAELDNAILYSTLFHHNTVSGTNAVMKVGTYGYLLNATIEGKTIGADGTSLLHGGAEYVGDHAWENTTKEEQSHVYCSLVNFNIPGERRHEPTIKTLSGYCYALEDENLNYQLTENSVNIDNYHSVVPAGIPELLRDYASAFTPAYTADEATAVMALINTAYSGTGLIGSDSLLVYEGKLRAADRDLLGNFRWQPGFKENPACPTCDNNGLTYNIIDRGCFETWKIEKPYFVTFPNYPYPGTCEYIMKNQALMIDPVDIEGDPSAAAHIPGFVLLQEGASLYGNGREIEIAYIGIERKVKKGGDLMVTIPWDQDLIYRGIDTSKDRNAVNGLFIVDYDHANGNALKTINRDRNIPVYRYDPTKRADWQYRMKPSESTCWVPMTEPILPACQGIYTQIVPEVASEVTADSMVVRCMGKGKNMRDYIYEELVAEGHLQHTGKAVTLYRHDDAQSTAGGADLTDAKNAGWNFIGYPYLISLYHPYTKAIITPKDSVLAELNPGVDSPDYATFLASENPYAMDRPQTMWLYYDGLVGPDGNPVDGTGGFYSVNSWLKEPSAWHVAEDVEPLLFVTEAFFVQTNTLRESEDLVFYRPTYRSHYGSASAPAYAPQRFYVGDENDNVNKPGIVSPEQVDSALIPYEKILRDGHVYIVRRDATGRINESFDLLGHRIEL